MLSIKFADRISTAKQNLIKNYLSEAVSPPEIPSKKYFDKNVKRTNKGKLASV